MQKALFPILYVSLLIIVDAFRINGFCILNSIWNNREMSTVAPHSKAPATIDVWEGASGASRDAPIFGLKSSSVSNAKEKLAKT